MRAGRIWTPHENNIFGCWLLAFGYWLLHIANRKSHLPFASVILQELLKLLHGATAVTDGVFS